MPIQRSRIARLGSALPPTRIKRWQSLTPGWQPPSTGDASPAYLLEASQRHEILFRYCRLFLEVSDYVRAIHGVRDAVIHALARNHRFRVGQPLIQGFGVPYHVGAGKGLRIVVSGNGSGPPPEYASMLRSDAVGIHRMACHAPAFVQLLTALWIAGRARQGSGGHYQNEDLLHQSDPDLGAGRRGPSPVQGRDPAPPFAGFERLTHRS